MTKVRIIKDPPVYGGYKLSHIGQFGTIVQRGFENNLCLVKLRGGPTMYLTPEYYEVVSENKFCMQCLLNNVVGAGRLCFTHRKEANEKATSP